MSILQLGFRSCAVATCARARFSSLKASLTYNTNTHTLAHRLVGCNCRCNSSADHLLLLNDTKKCINIAYYSSQSSSDNTTANAYNHDNDNNISKAKTNTKTNAKFKMRNKRNARIASLKQKEAALLQMTSAFTIDDQSFTKDQNGGTADADRSNDSYLKNEQELEQSEQLEQLKNLETERQEIFYEAHLMTLSLYRTCLRCVRIMRPGNTHDEQEFSKREQAQLDDMEKLSIGSMNKGGGGRSSSGSGGSGTFSFEPPVDRDNELRSRAFYYLAHVQESFGQEVECLAKEPWREDDTKRFVHLMGNGEERRRWIMKDYKFEDPYKESWDGERLKRFEIKVGGFVERVYKQRGWLLESEMVGSGDLKDTAWEEDDDEI